MASSIASQLQAIKSLINVDTEAPQKRPFTRPSILFSPKEAADIDLESLLSIALSGIRILDKLILYKLIISINYFIIGPNIMDMVYF